MYAKIIRPKIFILTFFNVLHSKAEYLDITVQYVDITNEYIKCLKCLSRG